MMKTHFFMNGIDCITDTGQGWLGGESTSLPPMWPRFDFRTRRQMWIEFVGSLLCYKRFFTGTPVFPSPQKTNI